MTSDQWQAVFLSVQVPLASVVCSLPLAVVTAAIVSKRFRGRAILETLINLPLILPPVVTGYLLLVLFGREGFLGKSLKSLLGLEFVFDFWGAVLAAAIVSFPLMVRAIRVAFDGVDVDLKVASRTLGLGPLETFFRVSLPLCKSGIVAGCLLGFARSMGEFGATIMIAGNIAGQTQTIPLYIFEQLQSPGGMQNAIPVVLISVAVAAIALWISGLFEGDRVESDRRAMS